MSFRRLKQTFLVRLAAALQRVSDAAARHSPPDFANTPRNLNIQFPRRINGAERITVGDDVFLGPNCVLQAVSHYPGSAMSNDVYPVTPTPYSSRIEIGDRVSATGGLQVVAFDHIRIEDDVMFATNVNLTDALHGFDQPDIPYKYQAMIRRAPISIGKGSWIGQNVVILPGVSIGEQCIIGANSTVTASIPARTIAFGNPARTHKKWNDASQQWRPTDES